MDLHSRQRCSMSFILKALVFLLVWNEERSVDSLLYDYSKILNNEKPQSCTNCVSRGGSWQVETCFFAEEEWQECPLLDVGCCTSFSCCVTSGCRSPNQWHWISSELKPTKCTSCCETMEEDGQCTRNYWDAAQSDDTSEEPWYNARESNIPCPESDEECPPCAKCTLHDERRLGKLREQHSVICGETKCEWENLVKYLRDPCVSNPNTCACWCQSVEPLLRNCPQLEEMFWDLSQKFPFSFPVEDVATVEPTSDETDVPTFSPSLNGTMNGTMGLT